MGGLLILLRRLALQAPLVLNSMRVRCTFTTCSYNSRYGQVDSSLREDCFQLSTQSVWPERRGLASPAAPNKEEAHQRQHRLPFALPVPKKAWKSFTQLTQPHPFLQLAWLENCPTNQGPDLMTSKMPDLGLQPSPAVGALATQRLCRLELERNKDQRFLSSTWLQQL